MSSLVLMQVTMTSLELVEFINSQRKNNEALVRHADFLVKVPKVLGEETSEIFRSSYLAKNGENRPCYKFPKREACLMAMSYSYDIQAKVFDRMTALEDALKGSPQIPQSLPDALRLAADLAEEKALLEAKVQADAPKVQFHDQVTEAVNCQTIAEVAKVMRTGEIRLFRWLREQGFLMADNKPYQQYIDRGYFRVVEGKYTNKKHGDRHTYTRTLITGRGFTFIQKRFMEVPA